MAEPVGGEHSFGLKAAGDNESILTGERYTAALGTSEAATLGDQTRPRH